MDLTKYIEEHHFVFDQVFDDNVSNDQLYQDTVQPLVSAAFQGSKVTCFAYGQTGSGKTFTMMGPPDHQIEGLYLLAVRDIFTLMEDDSISDFSIAVSFYEIYWGKLYDLLNQRSLVNAREDAKNRVQIVGLTEATVTSVEETMQVIDFGLESRTVGSTAANSDSSRSHAILQLSIKQPNGKTYGKLSFIDLAGNERGADTFDNGKQTSMDGAEINKSLLALKEWIRALDQSKKHIPFRGSKLTMVLKDSFQGNKCKTVMIANISPVLSWWENSLNTLRYADRVKELKSDKSMKEKPDALMLPRQATKTIKYDYKKPSTSPVTNLTGLAAIQDKIDSANKMMKHNSAKPQTEVPSIEKMTKFTSEPKGVNRIQKMTNMRKAKSNAFGGLEPPGLQPNKIYQALKAKGPIKSGGKSGIPAPTSTKTKSQISVVNPSSNLQNLGTPQYESSRAVAINWDESSRLEHLKRRHEHLVNKILQEEDDLLIEHKSFIDWSVEMVKKEMNLLHDVDKPGSDIEEYISSLDVILKEKMGMIHKIRRQLGSFYEHIKEEQELSRAFHEMQEGQDDNQDGFDGEYYDEQIDDISTPNMHGLQVAMHMEENLLEDVNDELEAFLNDDN